MELLNQPCFEVIKHLDTREGTENSSSRLIIEAYIKGFQDAFEDLGGTTSLRDQLESDCSQANGKTIREITLDLGSDAILDRIYEAVEEANERN